MVAIHSLICVIGITILIFHRRFGEYTERNWGYHWLGFPPGYLRASIFLLGLALTVGGFWNLIQLLTFQ